MEISIVIPNYNSENWYIRLLESIRNQTYQDYEVVIVDDISTDNSYKLIQEYIKEHNLQWTLVQNNCKRYNGGTRNEGVSIAKGEYIVFIDCDDYLYSTNALENIVKEIRKSQSDLIRLPYRFTSERFESNVMLNECTPKELTESVYVAPWTKCVKRELYVPFPEGTLLEDISQHIAQIDKIESIGNAKTPICVWNCKNKESISKNEDNPKRKASYWRIIGDLEELQLNHDYCIEHRDKLLKSYKEKKNVQ